MARPRHSLWPSPLAITPVTFPGWPAGSNGDRVESAAAQQRQQRPSSSSLEPQLQQSELGLPLGLGWEWKDRQCRGSGTERDQIKSLWLQPRRVGIVAWTHGHGDPFGLQHCKVGVLAMEILDGAKGELLILRLGGSGGLVVVFSKRATNRQRHFGGFRCD
jgi:hypothetical protein